MKTLGTSLEIPLHQYVMEAFWKRTSRQYYERAIELASAITLMGLEIKCLICVGKNL